MAVIFLKHVNLRNLHLEKQQLNLKITIKMLERNRYTLIYYAKRTANYATIKQLIPSSLHS